MFKIRRCEDKELIKKLHDEIFPTDEFYTTYPSIDWVVYNKENEPVGFCMLAIWKGNIGYHARAGICKKARGYNLQKRLIKVRENYCRKNNVKKIVTYTKIYNIASSRNLQKCHYDLYIPEYEYADPDCLYWIKNL